MKAFLEALTDRWPAGAHLEVRVLRANTRGFAGARRFELGDLDAAREWALGQADARNVYFGLQPRMPGQGAGAAGAVSHLTTLAVDLDAPDHRLDYEDAHWFAEDAIGEALELGLGRPALSWYSGGGAWLAWLLNEPIDTRDGQAVALWREVQRGIVAAVGGDAACTDTARIARMPGTLNWRDVRSPKMSRILEIARNFSDDRVTIGALRRIREQLSKMQFLQLTESPQVQILQLRNPPVTAATSGIGDLPERVRAAVVTRGWPLGPVCRCAWGWKLARIHALCPVCGARRPEGGHGAIGSAYVMERGKLKCHRPTCAAWRRPDGKGGIPFWRWAGGRLEDARAAHERRRARDQAAARERKIERAATTCIEVFGAVSPMALTALANPDRARKLLTILDRGGAGAQNAERSTRQIAESVMSRLSIGDHVIRQVGDRRVREIVRSVKLADAEAARVTSASRAAGRAGAAAWREARPGAARALAAAILWAQAPEAVERRWWRIRLAFRARLEATIEPPSCLSAPQTTPLSRELTAASSRRRAIARGPPVF